MKLVEYSVYALRHVHKLPVPAWKMFEEYRDALPVRDRADPEGEYTSK